MFDQELADEMSENARLKVALTAAQDENVRLQEELAAALADKEDALDVLLEVQELVETRHAQLTNTERALEYLRGLREEASATFDLGEEPEG